jgi:hypothetical protein
MRLFVHLRRLSDVSNRRKAAIVDRDGGRPSRGIPVTRQVGNAACNEPFTHRDRSVSVTRRIGIVAAGPRWRRGIGVRVIVSARRRSDRPGRRGQGQPLPWETQQDKRTTRRRLQICRINASRCRRGRRNRRSPPRPHVRRHIGRTGRRARRGFRPRRYSRDRGH